MSRQRSLRLRQGVERLSGSGKAETPGSAPHAIGQKVEKAPSKSKGLGRPSDVSRALRSVYDDTLREDIPSDLKDLLGRLG